VLHHNAGRPRDITHRKSMGGLKQTRVCGHVAFRAPGGATLDVFNTHLSLPNFLAKRFWTDPLRMGFGDNQLEEARALCAFVRDERRSDNVLIAGDFNSLPGSPVDRYLREEHGLVDGLRALHRMEDREARAFPTAGFLNLRMHLDHIYTSPTLEWLDSAGTHPFGHGGPFHGLSDHVPILATVRPRT
jgi:endonuclease/exonuclease/phosphatase family metal-dependent hydrolase